MKRNPYYLQECKQSLWKSVWRFLRQLARKLPAVIFKQMPKGSIPYYRGICTPTFVHALLTTIKNGPAWMSINRWLYRKCGMYSKWSIIQVETKRKIMKFSGSRIDLESILNRMEWNWEWKYMCIFSLIGRPSLSCIHTHIHVNIISNSERRPGKDNDKGWHTGKRTSIMKVNAQLFLFSFSFSNFMSSFFLYL